MNTISTLMEGRKTYVGIAIIILGAVGFGDVISEAELATTIDNLLQFAGICVAIYGRLVTRAK